MQTSPHSVPDFSASIVAKSARAKRVLLADDDPLVRDAVSAIFSFSKGFNVVGEATNGEEAIAKAIEFKPDLLVLDLNMPKKPGLAALRDLNILSPGLHTILLTVAIEERQVLEALQSGARGIVLKASARTVLMNAADAVMKGAYWINQRPVTDVNRIIEGLKPALSAFQGSSTPLTPREVQIVGYIVQGCTNKDIARTLATSEQVVKNHLGRIFDKLGVFNRLELALYAIDHNMAQRH